MKKVIYSSLVLMLVCFSNAYADMKRYLVKSGEIQYKITGHGSVMGISTKHEGDNFLYFKNYGAIEVTKEKITQDIMGQKEIEEDFVKFENQIIYSVDFDDKVIYKQKVPVDAEDEIFQNKAEESLLSLGAKKLGNDKIAGYTCTIWELDNTKMCIYKGVPLKIESSVMGINQTQIAISAKFNSNISKEKFKLPNYPIKSMKDLRDQRYKEMENQMENMPEEQKKIMQEMMNNMMKNKN